MRKSRKTIYHSKEDFLGVIKSVKTVKHLAEFYNVTVPTVYKYLRENDIKLPGVTLRGRRKSFNISELSQNPMPHYPAGLIKKRLIEELKWPLVCQGCGATEHKSSIASNEVVPVPLHLDHKDGNRFNNLLENLRLLCPNCHALTDTYCGRNRYAYKEKPVHKGLYDED